MRNKTTAIKRSSKLLNKLYGEVAHIMNFVEVNRVFRANLERTISASNCFVVTKRQILKGVVK